ncbi:hypothetical protein PMIN03_004111 [Paraphaeosphaeria minitans]|uniref:Uncharacterized protein n=1 Tax=Paraphaeosphaeria minitans TaxID=565426 RepID=A0A9P6G5S4_9PLEO|nr:hypothetical protein PMIN01_12268 [Paraphaeosphaeria minitans]
MSSGRSQHGSYAAFAAERGFRMLSLRGSGGKGLSFPPNAPMQQSQRPNQRQQSRPYAFPPLYSKCPAPALTSHRNQILALSSERVPPGDSRGFVHRFDFNPDGTLQERPNASWMTKHYISTYNAGSAGRRWATKQGGGRVRTGVEIERRVEATRDAGEFE